MVLPCSAMDHLTNMLFPNASIERVHVNEKFFEGHIGIVKPRKQGMNNCAHIHVLVFHYMNSECVLECRHTHIM